MLRLMFIRSSKMSLVLYSLRSTVLPELTTYWMTLKVPESRAVRAAI